MILMIKIHALKVVFIYKRAVYQCSLLTDIASTFKSLVRAADLSISIPNYNRFNQLLHSYLHLSNCNRAHNCR